MSLLRIRCSLADSSLLCDWAVLDVGKETLAGSGRLADLASLVRAAKRVQLIVAAAEVLLVRARLPPGVGAGSGAALAYAVEDLTIDDPDSQHVLLLGVGDGGLPVLAVMDRSGRDSWLAALEVIGAANVEVHDEALLLPWRPGEWSLAWDGREGFVRSGELAAAALDCGDRATPPLALKLLVAEARAGDAALPGLSIHLATEDPEAAPDIEAWSRALGIEVRLAAPWSWRRAPAEAGRALEVRRRRWRLPTLALQRLRPAMWLFGAAVFIHGLALVLDWSLLANEQRQLRWRMEARFRAVFPDAVAVVDPALQMRRKLAEARHAAGAPDEGDFLPMAEGLAAALRDSAPGALRGLSYESGRMTLELVALDETRRQTLATRLAQAGLALDPESARARPGAGGSTLTVRPK